ncbi:MAG TPA: PA2169 family four-helix-bundle protein [Acidobacteriaceae bacterium]|nr:PA2169 family four-helix-bundle protein [Acidobacteriaceae bacterium]
MSDNFESNLRSIIQVLHDGHMGLAEIGHHLTDQSAKDFLLKESLTRQQFAGELEGELHRHGVADVKEGGTAAGAVHRTWGEIKAHLGGGDHTLLATAEQGEDEAKKAYERVLQRHDVPLPIREILSSQQEHILFAHQSIKSLRDSKAA